MQRTTYLLALALSAGLLPLLCGPALAQDDSYRMLEVMAGGAHNFDSNLRIEQAGEAPLDFNAEWEVGGTGAMYYDVRFGWWDGDRAQEVEHLHHKMLLTNNPPEVENFQISHGVNMFMYNRAWRAGDWIQRGGLGLVITHAENTVRGLKLGDAGSGNLFSGYRLSGGCAQYALQRQWPIGGDWYFGAEAKGTIAWIEVPVVNGQAELWNYALHGLAGFGYRFD